MEVKRILWLEDQYEDFSAYLSELFRAGYVVDMVESVSEAVKKLREEAYATVIFDIKVLPGNDEKWSKLDKKKQKQNPNVDNYLGLELLYSIFKPNKANVKLEPQIEINPKKIIVLSVVFDKTEEISALGIPGDQIIYKSKSELNTLPRLIEKIQKECEEI